METGTLPLYWTDPDLSRLETRVLEASPPSTTDREDRGLRNLVLEQSPFYPGGGGQAPDRGTINGLELVDIRTFENRVIHVIRGDVDFAAGDKAVCDLDMVFRMETRQQHTGQHLISAALNELGLATVSVHLGNEYCGIEVESSDVEECVIARVLERCDEEIRKDTRVISRYLTPEESKDLPLRRSVDERIERKSGPIRVVEIEGVDTAGCGGVHLNRIGRLRMILFDGNDRIRGRSRLRWIIGDRAVRRAYAAWEGERDLIRRLSVSATGIPDRVQEILDENRRTKSAFLDSEKELGRFYGESVTGDPETSVRHIGGGMDRLTAAAKSAADRGVDFGFFLADPTDLGDVPWILYAKGLDSDFFQEFRTIVLGALGGTGGGKAPIWQGRIPDNPLAVPTVRAFYSGIHR